MIFDDENELVARLVRAGQADGPSRRALQAAPVAIGALLSSTAASAALVQVAGSGAAAVPLGKAALSPLLLLKWVAVGTVLGGSLMALSQAPKLFDRAETAKMASIRTASAPTPAPPHAPARLNPEPGLPEAEPASSSPASASAAPPRHADVAQEVAQLDAARRALVQGDAAEALRVLGSLERQPGRVLVPEATVLRARALLAQGKQTDARNVADHFCAKAPSSPQCPVLQALVANSVIQPRPSRL